MICTLLTVALSVIRRSSDLTNSSATSSSLTSALGRSTLNLCACKPPSFEKVTAASNTARYCVMPTRYQPAAWREPDRFRRAAFSCNDECVITIGTVAGTDASAHRDEVLGVWTAAFGEVNDPEEWAISPWDRHRSHAGYRLAVAHDDGRLVGFAWGYTGERGQYWSDFITRELGSKVERWVGGHFEFVELAVIPEVRGRGIGGQLHDALLANLDHRRALLATSSSPDDPAVRLYSSRGWVSLATYGDDRQVMGRVLSK